MSRTRATPRRRSLSATAAALAVGLLAACGGAVEPASPGPKLTLSAEGAQRATAENGARSADPELSSALAAPTYRLAGDALDDGFPAALLGYRSVASVDEGAVAALAAAFSLDAAVWSDDYGFSLSDDAGSSLTVDHTGAWWYSSYPVAADCTDAAAASTPDEMGGDVLVEPVETCTDRTATTGTVSAGDARVAAERIFAAAGSPPIELEVVVIPDTGFGETVQVNGIETIDGYKTGRSFEVGFTSGRLSWASGTLARLAPVGSYPTVSLAQLADRLNDVRYWTWGLYDPQFWARAIASADVDAFDPSAASASLELTAGELVLGAFHEGGDLYLLPSVHLTGADDVAVTVLLVDDTAIEFDDAQPDAGSAVPRPAPEPALEPALNLAGLVGRAEQDVVAALEASSTTFRIVERDGEAFAVTMDLDPGRVNLTIENGLVIDATFG